MGLKGRSLLAMGSIARLLKDVHAPARRAPPIFRLCAEQTPGSVTRSTRGLGRSRGGLTSEAHLARGGKGLLLGGSRPTSSRGPGSGSSTAARRTRVASRACQRIARPG
jgi:hypothetical protein